MAATIEDVAKEAGVSITTVSAVINDTRYVSPELTSKVEKAIEKLNYYPDQMGRGLRKGKSNAIGLLISDITNPFFPRVARGVEDCARENHYNLILCNTDEDPVEEQHYISLLRSQRVDGIIITPTSKSEKNIKTMIGTSVPVVLIDRLLEGSKYPAIGSDSYSGAREATQYLIDHGHRKIGFVGGLEGIQSTDMRYRGYIDALADNDISLDDALVVLGNSQVKDSYQATQTLLSNGKDMTAIFAANNLIVIGVMQYLKDNGISYPDDISILCFDDPEWGSAITPGITSVSQRPYEIGYEAGRQLFRLINEEDKGREGEKRIVLSTKLEERESVKRIN